MIVDPGSSRDAPNGPIDVFLCHNSLDKPVVRQVAEGLELEFGIPHFLDAYAIPTGEAFLPWIEAALGRSRGCAIFLGANGWGSTHFWEAELALERYRRDPAFRLIPVALPGIRDEDMRRLGAGSLFSEINWADFRNGLVDPDAIAKLRAALLGRVLDSRAPSRLTPYLIRRDANRWHQSGRRDKSILHRGRQLAEAEDLRTAQPDLVSGDAIVAFLVASSLSQTRRARIVAALAVTIAMAIAVLAIATERARRIALARFVAAEARQAPSTDTGLLLAVQATRISETPEAYGALLEKLDAQPFLRHMVRLGDSPVMSLAFDAAATAVYAGHADGFITRIDLRTLERTQLANAAGPGVLALDVDAENGDVWAGLQDGRVRVYDSAGRMRDIAGVVISGGQPASGAPASVLTLQIDPQRRWVAVGNHEHRLSLLDRAGRTLLWTRPISAQRVTSLSFAADGERLAAGSSEGLIEVFEVPTGERVATHTTAPRAAPRAVAIARNGDLRVIDDALGFTVFASAAKEGRVRELGGQELSAAAVGPRRELGPEARRDLFVIGFRSGDVLLTPTGGAGDPIRIRAHARTVYATALSADGSLAASGADDGTVAIWDPQRRSSLIVAHGPPGGEVVAMAYDETNHLTVVSSSTDAAMVSRLATGGWRQVADLLVLSKRGAGAQAIDPEPETPDADGFVAIPEQPIALAAFTDEARRIVWATRNGAVLWAPMPQIGAPRVLRARGGRLEALALSRTGRYVFIAEAGGVVMRFDAEGPETPPLRYAAPDGVRQMVGAEAESGLFVALDDGVVLHVDFSTDPPRETSRTMLRGTPGKLVRLEGEDTLLAGGAGSSAGIDVALVTGNAVQRLHTRRLGGAASGMALSRAAGIIAVGDFDGRIHLWDFATAIPMASLQIADEALNALAISLDGKQLAIAAGSSGDLLELTLERDRWRRNACDVVRRELTLAEWTALVPDSALKAGCERSDVQ